MPSSEKIRLLAVRWATRLIDDTLTAADEEELHRWLLENPEHAEQFGVAYSHIQGIFRNLPLDVRQQLSMLVSDEASINARRWRVVYAAAASILVTVFLGLFLVGWQGGWVPRTYSTQRAQTRVVTLPDGSAVHLNAQTTIRWPGFSRERRIELVQGEALFDVVHSERPFSVDVDDAVVQVLGTRFDLNRRPSVVVLTVLEGTVSVRGLQGAQQWSRIVRSDQRLAFSRAQLIEDVQQRADAQEAIGWREGVLFMRHEPIQELVDQLDRYSEKPIVIADDRVRVERVMMRIPLNDVRAALDLLEVNSPIEVRETEREFRVQYRDSATSTGAH